MSSLMIPKNNLKFNIKLSISLDNLSLLKSIFSKCSPKIHILHFYILNRGIMINRWSFPRTNNYEKLYRRILCEEMLRGYVPVFLSMRVA